MTIRAQKIYVDGSELPSYSVSMQRTVAAAAGSYADIINFSSQGDSYYLFVSVEKGNDVSHFALNFNRVLTFDGNNYVYYTVKDTDSSGNMGISLEVYSSPSGSKLRLHRLSASSSSEEYSVTIQNLAESDLSITKVTTKGTDSWNPEANNCVLFASSLEAAAAGVIDHYDLLHAGTKTHDEIDTHINAAAPHSGHALKNHTHTASDITDFNTAAASATQTFIQNNLATSNDIDNDIISDTIILDFSIDNVLNNN